MMVNKRASSFIPKGINGSSDVNALVKMCATMDESCRHNHMLEDDVYSITQRQHDSKPLDEMELWDL